MGTGLPVTAADSATAGAALAQALAADDPVRLLVLSEGLDINGEALVREMADRQAADAAHGRHCSRRAASRDTCGPADSVRHGVVEHSDSLHRSAADAQVLLTPFSPRALLRAVSSTLQDTRQ